MWTNASNRFGWQAYLGHAPAPDEDRPYAVPARRANLGGLPPAWIGVGSLDLFYDEDLEYAARLRAAGVRCELDVVEGGYHAFDEQSPRAPGSAAFTGRALEALRRGLRLADTSP